MFFLHWKEVQTRRDDPHLEEIKEWLESLGNPVGMIRPEDKTRYHCAAAVASNLVCGLVDFEHGTASDVRFQRRKRSDGITPYFEGKHGSYRI